ncbi:MAG TPA: stage 0 sporulation protein [Nitrospinae bacterium]|nr:stage 0 sporulation protein [Nitrospinota bacterium]HBA27767.1 stage 0 sporulation protein [Nitrospinota bacterium]
MTDLNNTNDSSIFVIGVRFKSSGKIYDFKANDFSIRVGDSCIIETDKGIELGIVSIARRKILQGLVKRPLKNVVRKATQEDINQVEKNEVLGREAFDLCQSKIREKEMQMKLVNVDFSFDAQKAVFYYTSEERVDFRELVKDLAYHFKIKIEMRQIGLRDEAKMIGGCGPCGRNLCCASFLKEFEPVSIKMAKDQNLALNPVKISGVCGRLMCCLVYEHETYKNLKRTCPKLGAILDTPDGKGRVVKINLLQEMAIVELEDGKKMDVDMKVNK